MKNYSENLIDYMRKEKSFRLCDLFEIELIDGGKYFIADFDEDIVVGEKVYRHDKFIMTRSQTKLQGEPVVDTVSVNIYTDPKNEKLGTENIIKACHDGLLDQAQIKILRCYFNNETGEILEVVPVFQGIAEVVQAGGTTAKLDIKSRAQGLAQLYPVRIFGSTKAFKENESGAVVSSSTDTTTMVIPLKPSKNVLIRI